MEHVAEPRKAVLNRASVARAALALIDEIGLESFSMRQLGARLGVEAMALYHHFPSKADLLDAVADELAGQMGAPCGGDWQVRLADSARRYRTLAIDHPDAFLLLTTRRAAGPHAFAAYERILSVLHEAGFRGAALAGAFRLLGYFVGGAGHAEIATRLSVPVARLGQVDAPDPARTPLLASIRPQLATDRLDAIFEFGLARLIESLELLLEREG